tara:strand:+ start:686 stop:838 length:153 start_codon:yes stop_codon:yes gene_type:complete
MNIERKELLQMIEEELMAVLREFKMPKVAVKPDFEEAQAEIIRQFAIPQE